MNSPIRLAILAIAAGLAAGCTAAMPPKPNLGSAGKPVVFTCNQTSGFPSGQEPGPGDLVVGPLWIINARNSVDPRGAGPNPPHGYKYPIAVRPGAAVTVIIAPPARGHIVIDNPYVQFGLTAATYRACSPSSYPGWSVFVQGLAFTDGRTLGCVPLIVRTGRETSVRRITISLYAGPCMA